jgi:hypothetical protein
LAALRRFAIPRSWAAAIFFFCSSSKIFILYSSVSLRTPQMIDSSAKKLLKLITAAALAVGPVSSSVAKTRAPSEMIYLDKLDKTLDDWWNALDNACRGDGGDLACDQRLALDKVIIKKGCVNIYPANNPGDTSYWKCRRP